jgi:hypothetical protein
MIEMALENGTSAVFEIGSVKSLRMPAGCVFVSLAGVFGLLLILAFRVSSSYRGSGSSAACFALRPLAAMVTLAMTFDTLPGDSSGKWD